MPELVDVADEENDEATEVVDAAKEEEVEEARGEEGKEDDEAVPVSFLFCAGPCGCCSSRVSGCLSQPSSAKALLLIGWKTWPSRVTTLSRSNGAISKFNLTT